VKPIPVFAASALPIQLLPHMGETRKIVAKTGKIRIQISENAYKYKIPQYIKGQSHKKVYEFLTWDGSFSLN
jgi:hypothetical protein